MKRMAVGVALVALGMASTLRADTPPSMTNDMPWYSRWFGIGAPPPPKLAPPPKPNPERDAARRRAKAEADLMRRLQACTELQQVALDTNNTQLAAKATDLEKQARELYMKQTAYLPCSRLIPTQSDSVPDSQPEAAPPANDGLMTPAITVPARTTSASAQRGGNP